ncbi:hypothetical protein KIPB_000338 [Kipferlia bialata]|uniref:UBC core domain-containing protein n=1 Tax=Kipferlia bialata TaxID=797122 RepID=A0A9K3GEL5_9EUKA|nr:hypothetical protein KIPB_000338 [Kipferlia bialata]|eukprot:g338.t1
MKDIRKLSMRFPVSAVDDRIDEFHVWICGPSDSPYEGGVFQIHVTLPPNYPYKSPSVGFVTRIMHPNVDTGSGSVCLDVLNARWTPLYGLAHVFETFIPHLLRYPNPHDPLNSDAARMLIGNEEQYKVQVRRFTSVHASPENAHLPKDIPSPFKQLLLQQSHKEEVGAGIGALVSPTMSTRSELVGEVSDEEFSFSDPV